MKKMGVIDFHCDLLSYLAGSSGRASDDCASRCSLSQLREGGVVLQVMALFAQEGPGSAASGERQLQAFKQMLVDHGNVALLKDPSTLFESPVPTALLAIEGGSSILAEGESFEKVFERLIRIEKEFSKIAYISLTWNGENRFGGGAHTDVGLKDDGRRLLDWLNNRKIALDLSHASDALIEDLFSYIDDNNLTIPMLASHSNSRTVNHAARNLCDEHVKELFRRRGVIGLNLIEKFIGKGCISDHISHLLSLGGEGRLCLGADYFCCEDWAVSSGLDPATVYPAGFGNAASYQRLLALIAARLDLDDAKVEGIACGNAFHWIKRSLYGPHE